MSELPVVIAGGGIAGLAAALGLARQGHGVALFEQAAAFSEVGAGLQMSPNGVRALRALGAWEAVEPSCVIPSEIHVRDGHSGRLLQRVRLGKPFEQRFGAPYRVCHRADLLAGLLTAARAQPGIDLRTGQAAETAESVEDHGGGVRLALAAGPVVEGKALIVADGIRSRLRASICGRVEPANQNTALYRALMSIDDLPASVAADCVTLWLCAGAHVVHYPVSNWQRVNVVVAVDDAGGEGTSSWQVAAEPGEVSRALPSACEPLAQILQARTGWQRWAGADLPALKGWTRGNMALVGDAAHATLPFLAQGAMMALEDGVVLSHALSHGSDIPVALTRYEQARRQRTSRIQAESRRMGRTYHARGAVAMARNLALQVMSPSFALDRLEWIYRWTPPQGG